MKDSMCDPAAQKPIIRLWQLDGIGLIVSHPSGVLYSNQTGGYACHHPQMEGAFVPLADSGIDQQAQLETHFTGPKWKGHCYKGIDEETAAFVDAVLAASPLTSQLKVDREQLAMSDEAWIHVIILPGESDISEFSGFTSGRGVITWSNSD